ncbi:hypothetical protein Trydic_g21266 [Trypoxylus dichotomus]
MHPQSKSLVGAATRYIAGRNALQTVYWRSSADESKFVKVSKTFNMGKSVQASPPQHLKNGSSFPARLIITEDGKRHMIITVKRRFKDFADWLRRTLV